MARTSTAIARQVREDELVHQYAAQLLPVLLAEHLRASGSGLAPDGQAMRHLGRLAAWMARTAIECVGESAESSDGEVTP